MCLIFYLFLLFSLSHAKFTTEETIAEDERFVNNWIDVPLDHFNLFDNRTWKMRFFENDEFFERNKPIFIEVGGEWTITGNMIVSGPLYDLAKKHQGMLVETEHRFYGKSLPFSTNFSTENLYFLQMEQALEDLAFFIDNYKNSDPKFKNSPVVLHGCSYPGMLVTWMRLRFPNLVDMAYASSAPLGVGLDYPEYFEIVNDVYANISVSCIDTIRQGFNRTAKLMKTAVGRKTVRDALKDWECGDPTDMNSYEILRQMMSILNVQNDPLKYEEVSCLVLAMDSDDTSDFQRLANLIVLKSKDQGACNNDGDDETNGEDDRNAKSWTYQICTEMGTFQTLSRTNSHHPFAMDATLEESVDECIQEFGEIMSEQILRTGVERVIRRYGGLKPKVTKVVTVQGTNDPWKGLAVLEDYTSEAPVLIAKGNHCIDLSIKDDDPQDLLEVRKKAKSYISTWLSQMQN